MSVVLWVLAALAAGVVTEEFLGWVTPACRFVLRRGAQRLPEEWQSRYAEEWQAELVALPEGALTRTLWTTRTLIGLRSLRATLAESRGDGETGRDVTDSDLPLPAGWVTSRRRPTVLRITLGAELRRLREECGVGTEDAGWEIRSSAAKIDRLESGRIGMTDRDLLDLLGLYGVDDPALVAAFRRLARQADNPGWWHQYADLLPSGLPAYIGLERSASLIRSYSSQHIPDLLQTPNYAYASLAPQYARSGGAIQRTLDVRLRRQEVLTNPMPPRLWAVIDEAALRRQVGGQSVMRAQIERLIEISHQPNVSLQVLRCSSAVNAVTEAFTIFKLPDADLPNIVHIEQLTSSLYLDDRADVDYYSTLMDALSISAPPPSRTRDILQHILADLSR